MNWVVEHWQGIVAVVTGAVTVASAMANLTPNDTDNKIVAIVAKIIDVFALNFRV